MNIKKIVTPRGYVKPILLSTDLEESFEWACEGPHHLLPYKKGYKPLNEKDKQSSNMYGDHLRELKTYLKGCNHITEVGHNMGHTARLFASLKPKKLIAIDIEDFTCNGVPELCKANNIDYKFILSDSLSLKDEDIEQTDFLWLDGNHSASYVYQELVKFSPKVNKYIFSDDVEAEGTPGPTGYGVLEGFNKFLEENNDWELYVHNTLGPGFIGIKRK